MYLSDTDPLIPSLPESPPDARPICECGADLAYGQVVCHSCRQKYMEEDK